MMKALGFCSVSLCATMCVMGWVNSAAAQRAPLCPPGVECNMHGTPNDGVRGNEGNRRRDGADGTHNGNNGAPNGGAQNEQGTPPPVIIPENPGQPGRHKPGRTPDGSGQPPGIGNDNGTSDDGRLGNGGRRDDRRHKHRRRHGRSGGYPGIDIYPGYGYFGYPGYGYDGYYDAPYYDGTPYYTDRPYYRAHVTCTEALRIVRANGYRNVRTQSCATGRYRFSATKRGAAYIVVVSSKGRIISARRR